MDQVLPNLHASPPTPLPFADTHLMRAFLLRRDGGDLIVYNAPDAGALGGAERQYLNHWHEARFGGTADLENVPLYVHVGDKDETAETHEVAETFTEQTTLGDDFEIVPIPGHTPGATAFLWASGEHRVLFTGDSLMVDK